MNVRKRFFLEIDGELVPMELTKFTANTYKRYFRRNFAKDMQRFSVLSVEERGTSVGMAIAKIIWVLAKTAKPKIQPFYKWFDGLGTLPVYELFPQILEEIMGGTNAK